MSYTTPTYYDNVDSERKYLDKLVLEQHLDGHTEKSQQQPDNDVDVAEIVCEAAYNAYQWLKSLV